MAGVSDGGPTWTLSAHGTRRATMQRHLCIEADVRGWGECSAAELVLRRVGRVVWWAVCITGLLLRPVAAEDAPAEMTVEHAGGMVRWDIPADWFVMEYPFGREIRLALSPARIQPKARLRLPPTHLWFTVHAEVELSPKELVERLRGRSHGPDVTWNEPLQEIRIAGFAGRAAYATRRLPDQSTREFVHGLVPTPWGVFEFHVESPDATFVGRWVDRMIRRMVLRAPRPVGPPGDDRWRDARAILGSWKAYRARWRFEPSGRVVMAYDRRLRPTSNRPTPVLEGTFQAVGDLVKITWRDGSHLNLRWRREGPWLLTTDHEGRVAQLRRIYE